MPPGIPPEGSSWGSGQLNRRGAGSGPGADALDTQGPAAAPRVPAAALRALGRGRRRLPRRLRGDSAELGWDSARAGRGPAAGQATRRTGLHPGSGPPPRGGSGVSPALPTQRADVRRPPRRFASRCHEGARFETHGEEHGWMQTLETRGLLFPTNRLKDTELARAKLRRNRRSDTLPVELQNGSGVPFSPSPLNVGGLCDCFGQQKTAEVMVDLALIGRQHLFLPPLALNTHEGGYSIRERDHMKEH
ncbi:uncharacterized protein LOC125919764 [Panthera uncia]|uniref:uncharacterized protein LOC125919764 n=1 Tax=Panthera uncia TaxID=29064 RepID=UPI0020FFA8B2|nr:uncharacterized protein LOC125919764 [Panthera uncia]